MAVADKMDGVCGAANQGPEGGPSSPCGRVPRLDFNSHSSRSSAASESTPKHRNTSPALILRILRSHPCLAACYSWKTHGSRSPTIADDVGRDPEASDGLKRSHGTRLWPLHPSLVLRWARSAKFLIVLGGRGCLHAHLDVFPSILCALP